MGTRGAGAVFMPNKVVFPGGAVDPADAAVPAADGLGNDCFRRLAAGGVPRGDRAPGSLPRALIAAAIREVWEETGLVLGAPGAWPDPPQGWRSFAKTGHLPSAKDFRFVFRAVTPPGRPRRFDARFFLVPATSIQGDPDDFGAAEDELQHLGWIPLTEMRQHDLPFITELVLAEIGPLLAGGEQIGGVPFVTNEETVSQVARLV